MMFSKATQSHNKALCYCQYTPLSQILVWTMHVRRCLIIICCVQTQYKNIHTSNENNSRQLRTESETAKRKHERPRVLHFRFDNTKEILLAWKQETTSRRARMKLFECRELLRSPSQHLVYRSNRSAAQREMHVTVRHVTVRSFLNYCVCSSIHSSPTYTPSIFINPAPSHLHQG